MSLLGRTGGQASAGLALGREAMSNVEILCNLFKSTGPKTFERLVHDLYIAGWTIEEAKTLLNGGKIEEEQEKN